MKKGPPKFFDNKPKAPSTVPMPTVRTGRGLGPRKGAADASGSEKPDRAAAAPRKSGAAPAGKASGGGSLAERVFGGGENWKTFAVIGISAVLLVAILITYVRRGYQQLDQSRAVQELALVGAALQAIDTEMGGLTLARSARNDAAVLKIARDIADGGKVVRSDAGEITGTTPPEKGATRLFVPSVPERSTTGALFHFDFPTTGAERLPAIGVQGVGTLQPPDSQGRWPFDGDLAHVPRQREIGGELVPVRIKRPDGSATMVNVFKPRGETPEPTGEGS